MVVLIGLVVYLIGGFDGGMGGLGWGGNDGGRKEVEITDGGLGMDEVSCFLTSTLKKLMMG